MRLSARIAAIEKQQKPAQLGWKIFQQDDNDRDVFYDETYDPSAGVDSRRGLLPGDRTGQRRYTRQEIKAVELAGWDVISIEYADDWREHDNVLAVVQPGMMEKL